ncbi:hypothetical protein AQUCO_02100088v1 [Aquilegia coerulea]|uniref:Uncharacterized protein n=1 Tax=Aquilegia coerulea TaxID=218851 RepID=A0A2G5DEV5_AQUCA|nr:hypothetical protein AQUCO_02100088v1 [Aquilegia coerulea]
MTGRVCLKSPPRTTVTPPNGSLISRISLSVRSTASTQNLCCIGTSSHIISFALLNNSAWIVCFVTEQTESSRTSNGILNVE